MLVSRFIKNEKFFLTFLFIFFALGCVKILKTILLAIRYLLAVDICQFCFLDLLIPMAQH